jgi:hypothetical protein
LKNTSATDELGQTLGIGDAGFPSHIENRLRLGRKIECIGRFVVVDPVHAIPVIEKSRLPQAGVD